MLYPTQSNSFDDLDVFLTIQVFNDVIHGVLLSLAEAGRSGCPCAYDVTFTSGAGKCGAQAAVSRLARRSALRAHSPPRQVLTGLAGLLGRRHGGPLLFFLSHRILLDLRVHYVAV